MFTHSKGMVSILGKEHTERKAVASCVMEFPTRVCEAIFDDRVSLNEKGDIIGTAKLAGVMGAKKTSELIPLCHPLFLSQVSIEIERESESTLRIRGLAACEGQTGVEMEALTAVSVAALTMYDMTKSSLKGRPGDRIVISSIQLDSKTSR